MSAKIGKKIGVERDGLRRQHLLGRLEQLGFGLGAGLIRRLNDGGGGEG